MVPRKQANCYDCVTLFYPFCSFSSFPTESWPKRDDKSEWEGSQDMALWPSGKTRECRTSIMCCRNRLPEVGRTSPRHKSDSPLWLRLLEIISMGIVVMSFHISLVLRPPLLILHSILQDRSEHKSKMKEKQIREATDQGYYRIMHHLTWLT